MNKELKREIMKRLIPALVKSKSFLGYWQKGLLTDEELMQMAEEVGQGIVDSVKEPMMARDFAKEQKVKL